jgi:hypothetical protein
MVTVIIGRKDWNAKDIYEIALENLLKTTA